MQRLLLAGLVVLLFAPLASASPASGEIVSDAPIALYGRGEIEGPGIELYHQSFESGSLSGVVYDGQLVDHVVLHLKDQQPSDCNALEGRVEEEKLRSADGAQSWQQIEFKLLTGAAARWAPQGNLRFSIGSLESSHPDEGLFGYLGTSPYTHVTQPLASSGAQADLEAPLLPKTPFLAIPNKMFHSIDPGTLEVYWGQLETVQQEETESYRAGVLEESRTVDSSGPLPFGGDSVECQVRATHTLRFSIHADVLSFDQSNLERILNFWKGALPEALPRPELPPLGTWNRSESESFSEALAAFRLPATVVTAAPLEATIAGRARFQAALGGLSLDSALREAHLQSLLLGGNFHLKPKEADAQGRRLTTSIEGDIDLVQLGDQSTPAALAKSAPYLVGASMGIAVLGAAYWSWPATQFTFTRWALFPLYARLRKEDILENPVRDDILGVVEMSPGISASELGRRLSCGWGTLVYHLTVLERMQLISSAREGRHKRFFVQGRINYSDKGAASLLANPSARTILDAIRVSPGLIQRDLSRALSLTPGTIGWHVERLEQAGLVVKEEEGRTVRYYPSSKLLELTQQLAA